MTFLLTFLGKGGVGRSTVAIAAAQQLASQNKRVLLASHDTGPALGLMLGIVPTCDPQSVMPNFDALQFQSTTLLERSWDEVKQLESQYLKDPFFGSVYGQELGILPGMDDALALNALREYESSATYDVIIYDGRGDQSTLRMFGMPDILGWYFRRFRTVFLESDFVKTLAPFVQPVTSAVLNVDWGSDWLSNSNEAAENILSKGKTAVSDPSRVAASLVTTKATDAIATAQYLWGSAQQIGLTVNGVLFNQTDVAPNDQSFAPLTASSLPICHLVPLTSPGALDCWQPLLQSLPDMSQLSLAPQPVIVDIEQRIVKLFLPYFNKKQVKLTQYGTEVTVEAGDQRRNIFLPPELRGKSVTGAKFQDSHLIISF